MNKYWVVGTSAWKYIMDFKKALKSLNLSIGSEFSLIMMDELNWILSYQDNDYPLAKSKATSRQILISWQSLGFTKKISPNKYIVIFDDFSIDSYWIDNIKWNLLLKNSDKEIKKYRFTKIINILYYSNKISFKEIQEMGINQTKGILTERKIQKELSNFEKECAKDDYFTNILKKEMKNG